MTTHISLAVILSCTFLLALCACSGQTTDRSLAGKIYQDTSLTAIQPSGTPITNSAAIPKDGLTKIYAEAIAQYIRAVNNEYKLTPDTLFFGKHVYGQPDDFPDIELPGRIENTNIRLITPEEGVKKQRERKSLVFINMMGWVKAEKAEFILVTFSNGGAHQFDCYINYKYNPERKEFELEHLRFEN